MIKNLLTNSLVALLLLAPLANAADIIHDAEYYVIQAQNGERWDADDK